MRGGWLFEHNKIAKGRLKLQIMLSDGLKVLPLTGRAGSNIEILIHFLIKILIHFLRRFGTRFVADHAGGYADDGAVGGYVRHHHAARADFRAFVHADVAQHGSVRAYHHAVADFRVAVTALFARTAEGYAVKDGNVVTQNGGFADEVFKGLCLSRQLY